MRSADPVSRAADLFWDEWSFLLLRAAFTGVRRFEDFLGAVPISRNRLAERLLGLVDAGLLTKEADARQAGYRLAAAAHGLYPVIVLLLQWAREQLALRRPSLALRHRGRHALELEARCTHCRRPVAIGEVAVEPRPAASPSEDMPAPRGAFRRRFRQIGADADAGSPARFDPELAFALDAVGDRWSVLVLRSAFFGVKRFDEFRDDLGIARNILADRLVRLQAHGLLASRPYTDRPPRHEYLLTDRSRALYPAIVAMRSWSLRWIDQPVDVWRLRHRPCGRELDVDVRCRVCGEVPDARDVLATASVRTPRSRP